MINNLDKILKSNKNLIEIIKLGETNFKKKFNNLEQESLASFVKKTQVSKLNNKLSDDLTVINKEVILNYVNYLKQTRAFDLQDYLYKTVTGDNSQNYIPPSVSKPNTPAAIAVKKAEITHSSQQMTLSSKDKVDLARVLNRESLLRDSNILIDSRYQNLANSERNKISFTIVSDTKNKTPGSGVIISLGPIKDIVEIEVFPFSIPYLAAADNYYNKISLSILELSSISIDAYEGSQFHFLFSAEKKGNLVNLIPINPIFRFYKNIAKLTNFTLQFGSPLAPIYFDKDRLLTKTITYTNPGEITFNEDHNLTSSDLIYITDFTSNNPSRDLNIINAINTTSGHICTRVSNTIISINVDFTLVTDPNLDLTITIYFGSKRILMPLRIRYITDDINNF